MRLPAKIGLAALVLAASSVGLRAGQVVLFTDGRSMEVERAERREEMVLLSLQGGGSIAVPSHRVEAWTDLAGSSSGRGQAASGTEPDRRERWRQRAGEFAELFGLTADRYELDAALLTAVAEVESAFDPTAVSHKGARGMLQLMPETARRFGVDDVFDVSQNVDGGARYLKWLIDRYEGRTDLALAGYNAGEAAVDRYQGIPPFPETRDYVARVLEGADRLSGSGAGSPNGIGTAPGSR
jgi:hypothetical protein